MMMGDKKIASKNVICIVGKVYKTIDKHAFIKETVRRPMGPVKDLFEIWNNRPIYDISKLFKSTLIIYGENDLFADKDLYEKLKSVHDKKEIIIKDATHWVIYEKNRNKFYIEVIKFLNSNSTHNVDNHSSGNKI